MTRRGLIACLVLCLVLVPLAVAVSLVARPRAIGPASYRAIRAGMSKEQVEAVIGVPAGDYYVRHSPDWRAPYSTLLEHRGEKVDNLWTRTKRIGDRTVAVEQWRGNHFIIHVAFDEAHSAVAWSIHEILTTSEPISEQVRTWFAH